MADGARSDRAPSPRRGQADRVYQVPRADERLDRRGETRALRGLPRESKRGSSTRPTQAQKRFGPAARADCTTCHAFTLEGTGHRPTAAASGELTPRRGHAAGDCRRCHAEHQGATPGVEVHATNECLSCHRPHEHDKPQSAPCRDCHSDVTTTHAAHGKSPSAACSLCHQHQHAPASAARPGCADLPREGKARRAGHGSIRRRAYASASAATARTSSRRRRQSPAGTATKTCTCSARSRVRAARRMHELPRAARRARLAGRACAGCHKDKHPDHPQRGVAGTCVGCHDPHPASARLDARVAQLQQLSSDRGLRQETSTAAPTASSAISHTTSCVALADKPGLRQLSQQAARSGRAGQRSPRLPELPRRSAASAEGARAWAAIRATRGSTPR